MRRAQRRLVHDGEVEPPLPYLREAYRDRSVPSHDDTVTRLFDRYTEALDEASASRRPASARERAAKFARVVRRRMHR
jgi:hypothetical protein